MVTSTKRADFISLKLPTLKSWLKPYHAAVTNRILNRLFSRFSLVFTMHIYACTEFKQVSSVIHHIASLPVN